MADTLKDTSVLREEFLRSLLGSGGGGGVLSYNL